jgi:hypothetical protein
VPPADGDTLLAAVVIDDDIVGGMLVERPLAAMGEMRP